MASAYTVSNFNSIVLKLTYRNRPLRAEMQLRRVGLASHLTSGEKTRRVGGKFASVASMLWFE